MNSIPSEMLMDVTNRCNYACVFCTHPYMKLKRGEIDPALADRILHEAYEMGIRRVGFYTTGEMFLCRNIETHIRNAKKCGFTYIYSDTNGALATKENMKRVLLAGLDSIKFSINAGSRETYRQVHGKDYFDTVLKNLADCHALRDELGLQYKIMVSCVVTSLMEHEVAALRELVAPYTDELFFHGAEPVVTQSCPAVSDLTPVTTPPEPHVIPCPIPFFRVQVTYDGYLSACCRDYDHELLLADLKTTSLQEAWNSERAVHFRERHLKKDVQGTMCYKCAVDPYSPYEPLAL